MRIYLVRHGRQSDARCNVDVGLADEGCQQADLAGKRVASWGVSRLYSSDMIRTRQTAAIIGRSTGLEPEIVPELRELDFGSMEGLTNAEIDSRFAVFKHQQATMETDLRYPGGETIGELLARVVPTIVMIGTQGDGNALVVTHGVVIRALVAHVIGAAPQRWLSIGRRFENCGITELCFDPDTQRITLERLNDFAHLEGHPELLREAWGVREH